VSTSHLIVGLGNPGAEYAKTRHNIGFRVLDALASKNGVAFQKKRDLKGEVAKFNVNNKEIMLLKPSTYMNLSGESVRKCLDYFKLGTETLFVISDDVDLPFGQLRLRSSGSSGGHNGLKSIESVSGQSYYRLKIGVGKDVARNLADHVLDTFTFEEEEKLPEIVKNTEAVIMAFSVGGYQNALNEMAQLKQSKK
jgi:PTH1 family peptidyl-tRNA hydrolase